MVRRIDILRKFVLRQNIEHLLWTSPEPTWCTFTFWENVTVKAYAENCWRKLRQAIKREIPDFRAVGIWARQGRGAWHIHLVSSHRLDAKWLRNLLLRYGFGPQMWLKEVDSKPETPDRLARYIGGYCTDKNGLDPERDKGVRRMIFVGANVKVVDMRYRSRLKRITSAGRVLESEMQRVEWASWSPVMRELRKGEWGKKTSETWGDWYRRKRGFWFEVGWNSLTPDEQAEARMLDKHLQRFFNTGQWSYI